LSVSASAVVNFGKWSLLVCRYQSKTFPGWVWKGDTSSDEITGHM
jgi:hypothetical protein